MAARTHVRPTVFGVVLAVLVALSLWLRPPTADPSVAGLVGAGMLGVLVVGLVWPLVVVARIGLDVRRAPTDVDAGQLASVELEVSGRATALSLSCTGSGVTVLDVVAPGVVRLPLTVAQRGVYRRIQVDVGSDAPFGVLRVQRTRVVALPTELLVGPVPSSLTLAGGDLPGDADAVVAAAGSLRGDVVRSTRAYVPGDPSHLVHWPSSARAGELVVRELDPPAQRGLAIVVDLTDPWDGAAAEQVAADAAGAAAAALADGQRVVLCTAEPGGPVAGEVRTPRQVRLRLARAVQGRPAQPPGGWPSHRLAVDPVGGT